MITGVFFTSLGYACPARCILVLRARQPGRRTSRTIGGVPIIFGQKSCGLDYSYLLCFDYLHFTTGMTRKTKSFGGRTSSLAPSGVEWMTSFFGVHRQRQAYEQGDLGFLGWADVGIGGIR
jgi:hypothetical protein